MTTEELKVCLFGSTPSTATIEQVTGGVVGGTLSLDLSTPEGDALATSICKILEGLDGIVTDATAQ